MEEEKMTKNKKENTYWGVKESEIDEALLKRILKYQKIALIATLIYFPIVSLNLVFQMLNKYINHTFLLVFSIILIIVACVVIVLYSIYLANMLKLKKLVKGSKKKPEEKKENNKQGEK